MVMAGMPNGWGPTGLSDSQLDTTLAKIKAKASEIGADANVLRRTMVPYSPPGQPDTGACICRALLLVVASCLGSPAADSCMATKHFSSWLLGLHIRSPIIDCWLALLMNKELNLWRWSTDSRVSGRFTCQSCVRKDVISSC